MELKKHSAKILLLLFMAGGAVSCSDNNDEKETPKGYPTTPFSKIELTQTIQPSDAQTVTAIQTYTYQSGRLSSYTSLQKYVAVEPVEMKSVTNVTYGDHQAMITDDSGTISTYVLNDKGYAISSTRKEMGGSLRTYTFSYLINSEGKHFLQNITETREDGEVFSSIDLDYSTYRALRITQKIGDSQQAYTATTQTGHEIKNISEIPCLFFEELYPMVLHPAALYGKLLGEPFETFITQIIPDGNTESKETINYTYSTNQTGIVTSCREVINSYGANYVRTVNYIIE